MKIFTCLLILIALTGAAVAQEPTPVPTEAQRQAVDELSQAASSYRQGKFSDAQAHAEKALQLDPQNKTALFFVARTIHAQYKPGDFTPENVAKARQAIVAYQNILDREPGDDEAYKATAYLYAAIKEEDLLREWILRRAHDVSIDNYKRAEAFVVIASKDWDCSFKITELPANKRAIVDKGQMYVTYRRPKDPDEFARAQQCANSGLEMANAAIALAPENESAWSYKTSILLELQKLAEMSGDVRRKDELQPEYEQANRKTTKLSQASMEVNKLVDAWIAAENAEAGTPEHESNFWAIEQVLNWSLKLQGDRLWEFITVAYKRDLSQKTRALLAAGPLEALLAKQGPEFIDRVEELARTDLSFNYLLDGVSRNTMTDEIWRRVQAARHRVL